MIDINDPNLLATLEARAAADPAMLQRDLDLLARECGVDFVHLLGLVLAEDSTEPATSD